MYQLEENFVYNFFINHTSQEALKLKKIDKQYFQQDIKSAINLFSTGRTNEALLKIRKFKKRLS